MERNAIIMAAGTASRFVPLSDEIPKGLLKVKGEILIERLIRQLQEAGINDIIVVAGYMSEKFAYLAPIFCIDIVTNEDFAKYNNTSSLIKVVDRLHNTYICCSDNYFSSNVFNEDPTESYYSALFANGPTKEYCIEYDRDNNITDVSIGGENAWYMLGHVYFNEEFSNRFKRILIAEYAKEETRQGYWEDLYIRYIKELPSMKIHKYAPNDIAEFDSLDELRLFDTTYINDTRSRVLQYIANKLNCNQCQLSGFIRLSKSSASLEFTFFKGAEQYLYRDKIKEIIRI